MKYNDVDVIYYDFSNIEEKIEKIYENELNSLISEIPWSVKNQARMHIRNETNPYVSSIDAINQYPERPTAICIKLLDNQLVIHYDHDFNELFNIVRPTPYFENEERKTIFLERIEKKE